jgi:hypothetical protein
MWIFMNAPSLVRVRIRICKSRPSAKSGPHSFQMSDTFIFFNFVLEFLGLVSCKCVCFIRVCNKTDILMRICFRSNVWGFVSELG